MPSDSTQPTFGDASNLAPLFLHSVKQLVFCEREIPYPFVPVLYIIYYFFFTAVPETLKL